jgi:hypothetical protein
MFKLSREVTREDVLSIQARKDSNLKRPLIIPMLLCCCLVMTGFMSTAAIAGNPLSVRIPIDGYPEIQWGDAPEKILAKYSGVSCGKDELINLYDKVCTKKSTKNANEKLRLFFKNDSLCFAYVTWGMIPGISQFKQQKLADYNSFFGKEGYLPPLEIVYRWRIENAAASFSCADVFCTLRFAPQEDILSRPGSNRDARVSLYGLALGSATIEDLARIAMAYSWRVSEISPSSRDTADTADKQVYLAQNIGLEDIHSLQLLFSNKKLMEITYWFVDPVSTEPSHKKTREDFFSALKERYGMPAQDEGGMSRFYAHKGTIDEVTITVDYQESRSVLRSITYRYTGVPVNRK